MPLGAVCFCRREGTRNGFHALENEVLVGDSLKRLLGSPPRYSRFDACATFANQLAASISEDTDRSKGDRESPDRW